MAFNIRFALYFTTSRNILVTRLPDAVASVPHGPTRMGSATNLNQTRSCSMLRRSDDHCDLSHCLVMGLGQSLVLTLFLGRRMKLPCLAALSVFWSYRACVVFHYCLGCRRTLIWKMAMITRSRRTYLTHVMVPPRA